LRADEVKANIEEFKDGFGDVIARISEHCHHEYASLADPRVGKQFTL
jgi:hypothetical protein